MPIKKFRVTLREAAIPTVVLRLTLWLLWLLSLPAGIPSFAQAAAPATASVNAPAPQRVPDPKAYYHFLRGYQAELANEAGTAQEEYLKALALDPGSLVLHLRLAALYHARGEHGKAQAHAEQVLAKDAASLPALNILAAVAVATGRSDLAIGYYERIVSIRPQETQAYYSMGMLLAGQKRYEDAERMLRQGIALSPTPSPSGYLYLGHVLVEQKAWDRAVQAYRDALAVNPGFDPAYLGLAATFEAKGDAAQAIATLRKYLQEVNRGNREVRHRLVRLLLTQKAYEPALVLLRETIQESPGDVEAQLRIGLIYGEMKEFPKAIAQMKLVLGLRPNELRVRDHLAYLYEEMKDYEKAVAEYRAIIQTDERFSDAHLHLGYLLYRLKRTEEALPHFRQVIVLNPKLPDAYQMLGLTLLQASRHDEAAAVFREGLQQNPDSADFHFNLGTAYDKLGRFDELVDEMQEAIRLDPKHADALNYLGYTFAERDMRLEEAVGLIQRALVVKPQNGYYLDSLAWAYFKMGRLQDALEEMRRAVAAVPDDPVFFEHLGDICLTNNLPDDAREAWLRSLELDPANSKLTDRFKAKGFGDPASDERIRKAQHKQSQKSP